MKWITRVPPTLSKAQVALEQTNLQEMTPLSDGYRSKRLASSYGGVEQPWVLIYSEHRERQAQCTVNKRWLNQSTQEVKAFKKLCRTSFACEADARQALQAFQRTLQATELTQVTIRFCRPLPQTRTAQSRRLA